MCLLDSIDQGCRVVHLIVEGNTHPDRIFRDNCVLRNSYMIDCHGREQSHHGSGILRIH